MFEAHSGARPSPAHASLKRQKTAAHASEPETSSPAAKNAAPAAEDDAFELAEPESLAYSEHVLTKRWRKLLAANLPQTKISSAAATFIGKVALNVTHELVYQMVEAELEEQLGGLAEFADKTLTLHAGDLEKVLARDGHPHAFVRAMMPRAGELRQKDGGTAEAESSGSEEPANPPPAAPTLLNFFAKVNARDARV